jgi:hypothetical protein
MTVSKVEQAALARHLTVQRLAMSVANEDKECLARVLFKLDGGTTFDMSRPEVFCTLRALRRQRQAMTIDLIALEERRLRGGHNGKIDAAWRALDADAMCIDDVVRRLWAMI